MTSAPGDDGRKKKRPKQKPAINNADIRLKGSVRDRLIEQDCFPPDSEGRHRKGPAEHPKTVQRPRRDSVHYLAGYTAERGDDCPYAPGDSRRLDWLTGYYDADYERRFGIDPGPTDTYAPN